MVILVEEKIGGEKRESSSEEESEVDSDDVPADDFEIEDPGDEGEGAEEGSESEEESDEDDLDDTLKEEDWKRESRSTEGANESSGDEDKEDENNGEGEDMEDEGDDEASEDEVDEEGNTGWADAMAKVLAMGKNSEKTVGVLSKAKKDNAKEKDSEGKVLEPLALRKARKRELDSIGRSMPNPLQRNAERTLTKIATRGVVQLFNAVREQQKDMKSQLRQAGGSFRKQEKVLKTINKANFINMLSGKATVEGEEPPVKRSRVEEAEEEEEEVEEREQKQSSWNILRDDFMLGAKMKDWDQESDGD